jgi:hypothetical protein
VSDDKTTMPERAEAAEAPDRSAGIGTPAKVRNPLLGIRVWLTVLSVILGVLLAAVSVAGYFAYTFASDFYGGVTPQGSTEDQTAKIEKAVRSAWGDALDTVTVTRVEVKPMTTGLPFSTGNTYGYGITYRLKGAQASIAGIVADDSALGDTGLLPAVGSLMSHMDAKQVVALSVAYKGKTSKPMGAISAYLDPSMGGMDPSTVSETLTVSGTPYKTSELWRVADAVEVKKGEVFDAESYANVDQRDMIFHYDPTTGEFAFLGTEPSSGFSMPF